MKIRLALVSVAAAVAVVATGLPASAATSAAPTIRSSHGSLSTAPTKAVRAAGVSFLVSNKKCFSNGITFTARQTEFGLSGVQQFEQAAREQAWNGVKWVNITTISRVFSAQFPNDGRNFTFVRNWTATHPVTGGSFRVQWQGFYLNGLGRVILRTVVVAVLCR
jgi:hypothetical protein